VSGARTGQPLLAGWTAPHGLPPFADIEPAHFEPALQQAMREHRDEVAALGAMAAEPDFDNTCAAFDRAGRRLSRLAALFHTLCASATSEALQAVQRRLAAPLAAHHSAIHTDAAFFARLDALHARRATLGLDAESLRLLERQHLDFVRNGAQLPEPQRRRHAELMQALAELHTRFGQNVLRAEADWYLPLPDAAAMAGLPPFVRAAARQAALERGLPGAVVTLARSLVVPFLSFSERADLREQVWRAWVGRGEADGAHDNRPLVREILRLRHELAGLMGHACYADFALADTMAGTRERVDALLQAVWQRAVPRAHADRQALQALRDAARPDEAGQPLRDWDWRFWAERLKRERFALDDAEVKPYFELGRVVAAAFDCAGRLFGLRFERRDDLPVYHPDVVAYEVKRTDGTLVGLFLQDNFARPGKRSGAWMNALRWQARNTEGGAPQTPIILNNNNFARGEAGSPTLLSLDDARTLFHEFGHGLHGLLSELRWQRLSGTQVLRDFVELPSQLFEHWITEPEVLRRHARHWQTGEPMPDALLERLQRARRFNQAYETVRYTASALLDMALHARTEAEPPADVCAWEREFLAAAGLPEGCGVNHRLVHFQHLFSGSSYAAGYYVYLWAEVLDADGYGAFAEAGGPFDAAVAERLRRHVYAAGNGVEPNAAFAAFRGRPPTLEPLLAKRGLLEDAAEPA
jgi:peptidyl-dipeptidase Dcp